ncbi:MAG: globin [Actinobacteria bacterium]|jgi:hemoglobin|nr:globin [Micrococcales bacterium]MCB0903942.1 globin [Actinomycetota bacterium]MCO5300230.1 globin [Candidatus Nanopelagicales bacterium]MCB9430033.1 globin [Actinomycetota bacterium]HPE12286.1 globin [Actinomycetota bacterium]
MSTPYEQFGGEQFFTDLVADFYRGVAQDPGLRPMYPEQDLGPAERRLRMFLEQYWGGPKTYSAERGHPKLRMRHAPFEITDHHRDLWLKHMRDALDNRELPAEQDRVMWDYLVMAAQSMVNQPTTPVRGMLLDPPG